MALHADQAAEGAVRFAVETLFDNLSLKLARRAWQNGRDQDLADLSAKAWPCLRSCALLCGQAESFRHDFADVSFGL